jgi:hypothetical protein
MLRPRLSPHPTNAIAIHTDHTHKPTVSRIAISLGPAQAEPAGRPKHTACHAEPIRETH